MASDQRERDSFLESLRLSGEKITSSSDLIYALTNGVKSTDDEAFDEALPDEAMRAQEARKNRRLRFDGFTESLTTKQATVIRKVFLKNSTGRTQEEIAKSLKITHRALRDRLNGAIAKLRAAFPELAGIEKISRRQRLLSYKSEARLPLPIRFTDRLGNVSIVQVSKENPHPFGAPAKRKDIDEAKVRAAIRAESQEKLHFLRQRL